MEDETKNVFDVVLSAIQLVAILIGAMWAYFRFSREGTHTPRIELDLACIFLESGNPKDNHRVAAFTIHARNKGHIEHKFDRISLRLRGIKSGALLAVREDKRLEFPEPLMKAELIPKKVGYYFVRPGVEQQVTFATTIPADVRFVLARAAFKYENSDNLHSVEKVFDTQQTA
jgi:hypothetical protein